MVHVSEIKTFLKCPKLYKETYNEPSNNYNPYIRKDEDLTALVMEKLHVKNAYIGKRGDTMHHTCKMMKSHDWMVKARFEYQGLRVKVPFLKKSEGGYWLYFVQMQNYPREEDLIYYYSMYYVLSKNNIKIKKIRMVHFNANYRRGKTLDPVQLLKVSSHFYNDAHLPNRKILDVLKNYYYPYHETMKKMKKALVKENVPSKKGRRCLKKTRCELYNQCFKSECGIPVDSILTLTSSKHKQQMYDEGILLLKDADMKRVEKSRNQMAQINASQQGGCYVNKERLKAWLSNLNTYPIAFIDMEWDTFAIPPFEYMKTFEVICFQYSMDILDEHQKVNHHEYLGYQDCRVEFIEHLLNDIPKTGSIVAFNADGAEKIRLKELAVQYPKYKEALDDLCSRMIDISKPFIDGMVYDVKMRGGYSLKAIAHMIDEKIDYQEMEITYGMDAVYHWRMMDQNHTVDDEIVKSLLTYCGQDSYALVKIYQWLHEQIRN